MSYIYDFLDLIIKNSINIVFAIWIILLCKVFGSAIAYIVIKIFHIKENKNKIKKHFFYKPIKNFILILGIYWSTKLFAIPEDGVNMINIIFRICIILLVANGFSNMFTMSASNRDKLRQKFNLSNNDTVFNFMGKLGKGLIYVIAGFIIVSEFGYNLNGLVAGLGISSVVIALAAQDLAKNIIGGFSIITDKPFEIGDYIKTDSLIGTVEDITFRSTRIRNLDDQVVIVPNHQIVDSNIINCSRLEKRRYSLDVTLELSTTLKEVSNISEKINACLNNYPNILEEGKIVAFNTISSNGIDLKIRFYTDITAYYDFVKFKEEINYKILDLINKEHIGLAYDSKTVYLKKS